MVRQGLLIWHTIPKVSRNLQPKQWIHTTNKEDQHTLIRPFPTQSKRHGHQPTHHRRQRIMHERMLMLQLSQNWTQRKRLSLQEYWRDPVPRNKEDSRNNLSNDMQPHKGCEHQGKKYNNPRSDRRSGFLGKRSVPMSESLTILTALVANMGKQSMTLTTPIMCKTTRENKTVKAQILLDTGAGGLFMNSAYAKKHNFLLC